MAVTVEHEAPLVVLDTRDHIVEVGPGAESQFGPLQGSLLWELFPGSEPLFKPYYDEARRTGKPVEFVQFYDGFVASIRAVPRGDDRLELYWKRLSRIDTLTLDGLVETLDESLRVLDEQRSRLSRIELRKGLRIIEGGV